MRLGLIAGNGTFPFLVLAAARAQGHEVTVVAAKEEAFPELNGAATRHGAAIHWISLGQLGTCIRLLQEAGVTHAVLAGQVKHAKIFSGGIVPDMTFLSVLTRLTRRNTDGLIGAVADVLLDRGIELIDSTSLLTPLLARPGARVRREQHRAVTARVHARHHQSTEACLSLPAAVETEHHARGRRNRTRPDAHRARSGGARRVHPHLPARRHPAAAYAACRGAGRGGVAVACASA